MTQYSVFRPVQRGDKQTTIRTAYPEFSSSNSIYSASGYGCYNSVYLYDSPIVAPAQSFTNNVFDGSNYHVVWKSIDHLYYRNPYDPAQTKEHFIKSRTHKFIFLTSSLLSIPQQLHGERIKPGSLYLSGSYHASTVQFNLRDDGQGNLLDLDINTSSFASASKLLLDVTFNNEYRNCKTINSVNLKDELTYYSNVYHIETPAVIKNITYQYGIPYNPLLDLGKTYPIGDHTAGLSAYFGSGSYIHIPHNENLDYNVNESFSISFWTKFNSSILSSDTEHYVISKRGTESHTIVETDINNTVTHPINITQSTFPYSLYVNASGFIIFVASDGTITDTVTSNTDIGDNVFHHVVVVKDKAANRYNLYIDSALDSSGNISTIFNTNNKSDIVFGALNISGSKPYYGNIQEVKFYNYAIDTSNTNVVKSLYQNSMCSCSIFQTNVIGNVFYKSGVINVSSPQPKFSDLALFKHIYSAPANPWRLEYRGEQTIIENEVLVRVPRDSFNMTLNPTVLAQPNSDLYSNEIRTGSLTPYITTIGLYNEYGECLAVGKIAQAIQKRSDVDINFILKWNT